LHSSSYSTPSLSSAAAAATLVPPPSPLKLAFLSCPAPPTNPGTRESTHNCSTVSDHCPSPDTHTAALAAIVVVVIVVYFELSNCLWCFVSRLKRKKKPPRFLNSATTADSEGKKKFFRLSEHNFLTTPSPR
jgi:hypothetical protein